MWHIQPVRAEDLSFNTNLNRQEVSSYWEATVIYALTSMYMRHWLKFFTNAHTKKLVTKSNKSGSQLMCPPQPHLFFAQS
jgi:hypothetical protein